MHIIRQFSDAELIDCIQTNARLNDAIAFIYKEHFEYLSNLVVYNNGSAEDAQDIVQEVVVNFIDLSAIINSGELKYKETFLHVMTRNTWLDGVKKRGRSAKRDKTFETVRLQDEEVITGAIENKEANNN